VIAVSVVVEASGPGRIAIENVPMSFLVPHTGTPVETVTGLTGGKARRWIETCTPVIGVGHPTSRMCATFGARHGGLTTRQ